MLTWVRERKRAAAERAGEAARVKALVRAVFGLDDEVALAVNEVACADAGCPDRETIVLVMRPGEPTEGHRIGKPLASVTEADVRAMADG